MPELTKLNLRLPVQLREDAAFVASAMGLSLNTFIRQAVANWTVFQGDRLARASRPAPMPAQASTTATVRSTAGASVPKVGANQPCPCGSGEKYKRCHGRP